MKRFLLACGMFASAALLLAQSRGSYGPGRIWWDANVGGFLSREEDYDDPDGLLGMRNASGHVVTDNNAFFEALGSNGRACITCHQPSLAMSVSADAIQRRWTETGGKDPIFAAIDGSNCPTLPQNETASHSLALKRGLFRIVLAWPPAGVKPEFTIEVVQDPTTCNARAEQEISVFRRPRVVANFGAATNRTLMADGREPTLESQAATAALAHEQAAAKPTPRQLAQIEEFERQIFAAQNSELHAGLLEEYSGPEILGVDNLISRKTSVPVSDAWTTFGSGIAIEGTQKEFRRSVLRGNDLFARNCASCHNEKAAREAMNIGTTAPSPDLPVFKVTCRNDGKVTYTSDPGRALITGKCADLGAIVPQQLRGLAARAPYFANGSAATLSDVVEYYDRRYASHFTEQQKQDLVNFLKVL